MIIAACFTLPAEIFSSVADLSGFMTLDCQLDCHKIGLCLGSRYLYFLQLFVGCRYHSIKNDHLAMVEEIRELRVQKEMMQQQKKEMVDRLHETKTLLLKEQEEHRILQRNIAAKAEEWKEVRKTTSLFVQEMIKEVKLLCHYSFNASYLCSLPG